MLALLHANASSAAPRLHAAALRAALHSAHGSAAVVQEQLRRMHNMPQLELASAYTLLQLLSELAWQGQRTACEPMHASVLNDGAGALPIVLLPALAGSLRLPPPERKRGPPTVPLDHLQALLQRCRPHQQRERQVLAAMVQHEALRRHLVQPLQALLQLVDPGDAAPGADERPRGGAGCAATMAEQGQQRIREGRLQLHLCAATGRPSYGAELNRQLAALLAAERCPFSASGSGASVQSELDGGVLTAEAVAATPGGLPVVLCLPRHQLAAAARSSSRSPSAPAPTPEPAGDSPPDEHELQVWVAGQLLEILGKRLRTALDFGGQQHQQQPAPHCGSQRASVALVRVAQAPHADGHLGSDANSWATAPTTTDLPVLCDQLWRLEGPVATILGGGLGGITSGGSAAELQDMPGAAAVPPLAPSTLVSWGFQGCCSGASVLAAAGHASSPACSGGLLLRIELQHVELAVLAHLSGQPELQVACRSVAGAYQSASHCWAAAAGQLHVPGSGSPGGAGGPAQRPLLICAATAEAVALSLVHSWSSSRLGRALRCTRQAAAAAAESFLAAFPQLAAWLAQAAAGAEAACCAATLAGRQRQFAALKRADDVMVSRRGRGAALVPAAVLCG